MRTLTIACLATGLLFQVGCTLAPKLTAKRNSKTNQQAAEKFLEARRLESNGKYELARQRYEEMLEKSPDNPDYLHRMGVVCTQLQRFGEANRFYEKARKLDPKNPKLLADMGYSFYAKGDYVSAERRLRESLTLKPSDTRTRANLALAVGAQGKMDESLSLLREAGDEASALAGLAYIHRRRGEIDLAIQRYQEALEVDPDLKDAIDGLAQVNKERPEIELIAKKKPGEKKASDAHAEAALAAAEHEEFKQLSATKDEDVDVVMTADVHQESSETDELMTFGKKKKVSKAKPFSTKPAFTLNDNETADTDLEEPDLELEAAIPLKNNRNKKAEFEDEDDIELTVDEPVKAPKRRKSMVQASFEESEFDLELEPTKKSKRHLPVETDSEDLVEESSDEDETL